MRVYFQAGHYISNLRKYLTQLPQGMAEIAISHHFTLAFRDIVTDNWLRWHDVPGSPETGPPCSVSFSVSNFRSFGQEETLNMVASNKLPDHAGHRVPIGDNGQTCSANAVIYGANAAGKSNLVQAMSVGPANDLVRRWASREVLILFVSIAKGSCSLVRFVRFLLGQRIFIYGFDVIRREFR